MDTALPQLFIHVYNRLLKLVQVVMIENVVI